MNLWDLRRIFAADLDAFEEKWLGTKGRRVADLDWKEAMVLWRIRQDVLLGFSINHPRSLMISSVA